MQELRTTRKGVDSLSRRPAPVTGTGTISAYLDDWDYEGSGNLVPTSTWTAVAGGTGADLRYFTEVFKMGSDWGHDFDIGEINRADGALYVVTGTVTFGGAVDSDDTLMLGINFGSSERHVFDHVSRDNTYFRVTGTAEWASNLSTFPASLSVWHNHGSDITIASARMHVRRFELLAGGEYENR